MREAAPRPRDRAHPLRVLIAAVPVAAILTLLVVSSACARPQVIVELENAAGAPTRAGSFAGQQVGGTDPDTRQAYKFQRQRTGRHFIYAVANLDPNFRCSVELSFVEHEASAPGVRRFNVYIQGIAAHKGLDIFSTVGANSAFQSSFEAKTDARGVLRVELRSDEQGCAGDATISTIRVYKAGVDLAEVDASACRNSLVPEPIRHYNTSTQDTYEAILGRLGSRASLDLLPQRLGVRYSSLGTWTGDLSELVIALRQGSTVRALPFTDRFPLWEKIEQSETMTSVGLECSSGATPLAVSAKFRAPFYPKDELVSSAPFFYIDVTVSNRSESAQSAAMLLARPHKEEFGGAGIQVFADGTACGIMSRTSYGYSDESRTATGGKAATESLAVPAAEAPGLTFLGAQESKFKDFGAGELMGWSAEGYPALASEAARPLYSFYPRGYTGATWEVRLPGGASVTKHFVLAGYTAERILNVSNRSYSDNGFKFRYTSRFAGVKDVIDYAAGERSAIEEKSVFFDSVFASDAFLALGAYTPDVRNLLACSFRTFLTNTWWARSAAGRDWFSVWEGTWMRFHATVDVEYNQAWFYYSLWPELLKPVMEQWLLYTRQCETGVYMPHDVGIVDQATGQAYDHDMPVEENLNFILMMYRYWKSSGDTAYMRSRFANVKLLAQFVMHCDTNGNGLPDIYCPTTFDDGTPALERGRDQSYLGFKCLAAYRAAREMALVADPASVSTFQGLTERINDTLEKQLWRSDHYAVALDPTAEAADRQAYSIHTANGLLYLFGGQNDSGLSAANLAHLKQDIAESTARTWGTYGSRHTSEDPGRMWISSNIWRDTLAGYLGVKPRGTTPLAGARAYWELEKYLGMYASGGYWDGRIYASNGSGERAGSAGVPPPVGLVVERPMYFDYRGKWTGGHDILGTATPSSTFYFAEGTCRPGYETYLCVQNPGASEAKVSITYMMGDGSTKQVRLGVAAASRTTVRPKDTLGEGDDAAHDFSCKVETTNGTGIVVERPTYFVYDGRWTGGHDVMGATSTSSTYYFAEGTCRPGFEPYLCVQNPGSSPVEVEVTYTLGDGGTKGSSVRVGPHSRATLRPKAVIGEGDDAAHDFSCRVESSNGAGIIVERPVYFNYLGKWTGGHAAVGATSASTVFYFAEGTCRPGFDPYFCIQNPGDAAASVEFTYNLGDGSSRTARREVPARSRATVCPRETLGTGDDAAHDFSCKVESTGGAGIIVERSLYFDYMGKWTGGHVAAGARSPVSRAYFAEGTCRPGFDPYICVQNPESSEADIKITYMLGNGSTKVVTVKVAPNSRATLLPGEVLGIADDTAHDFSLKVEATNGTAASPLMSYYPRGVASLGLIDSAAGLAVDNPENALYYGPAEFPVRVPVLNRADWSQAVPARRVPVMYFANGTSAPVFSNRDLLPATVRHR
jgi:hypothetical protein